MREVKRSTVLLAVVLMVMAVTLTFDVRESRSAEGPINVLAIDTSNQDTQILDAMAGISCTIVTPTEFLSTDLSDFQVLYVPSTFLNSSVSMPAQAVLNALNARKPDIENFIHTGHGVVALTEPIGAGVYTWLPFTVVSTGAIGSNFTHIVDPGHPVMSGLSDIGLSYWNTSSHNGFFNPGILSVLAINHANIPAILAGEFGAGKVVLAGLDADFHFFVNPLPGKQYAQFVQNAINWAAQPAIQIVDLDIKPGSCTNPVNINSNGVLPVAIPGSAALDVYDIDLETLTLEGVSPVGAGYEDVTVPFTGDALACETIEGDGIPDITLTFDTQAIAAAVGPVSDGEGITLRLTGALYSGLPIQGEDVILVLSKKSK